MAHPALNLFLPHTHNNQRAKLLWPQSILFLIGLYIMGRSIIDIATNLQPGVLGYASQIDPNKVIELTNVERERAGLEPLSTNLELSQAALAKASDMFKNNYWAHVSPSGTEPWYFITQNGYTYRHAGENLARDFSNPSDIVKAWMNSPTHKANLLDDRYKDIGIAVVDGNLNGVETTLVVQMFGTPQQSVGEIAASRIAKPAFAQEATQTQTRLLANFPASGLSPLDISRSWSLAFVIILLIALSLDWLFVLRYNLIRISGKSWAHITYLAAIVVIAIIIRNGLVL